MSRIYIFYMFYNYNQFYVIYLPILHVLQLYLICTYLDFMFICAFQGPNEKQLMYS